MNDTSDVERVPRSTERRSTRWDASRWSRLVDESRKWIAGRTECDACGCATRVGCRACGGTGMKLVGPRRRASGADALLAAVEKFAHTVGDIAVRGGEEELPERSRRFLAELREGLGTFLCDVLGRAQDLDDDLRGVPEERWPRGEAAWYANGNALVEDAPEMFRSLVEDAKFGVQECGSAEVAHVRGACEELEHALPDFAWHVAALDATGDPRAQRVAAALAGDVELFAERLEARLVELLRIDDDDERE